MQPDHQGDLLQLYVELVASWLECLAVDPVCALRWISFLCITDRFSDLAAHRQAPIPQPEPPLPQFSPAADSPTASSPSSSCETLSLQATLDGTTLVVPELVPSAQSAIECDDQDEQSVEPVVHFTSPENVPSRQQYPLGCRRAKSAPFLKLSRKMSLSFPVSTIVRRPGQSRPGLSLLMTYNAADARYVNGE